MNETPALAVSFFDPERALSAALRSGLSLLFDGRESRPLEGPAEIVPTSEGWHATSGEDLTIDLSRALEAVDLGGSSVTLCRGAGTAAGRSVDGLATVTETREPPPWDELEALRGLSAIFDERTAVFAVTRRLESAHGHGEEDARAVFLSDGEAIEVEDVRISTVYDADGRQRTSGMELWLPGEDWPRRVFGSATAGTSIQLEGLVVHAAVFSWRMDGRPGAGAYDLVLRDRPPVVA